MDEHRAGLSLAPSQIGALHDCYQSAWHGSEMYTPGSYSITCVLHVRTYLRSDFIVTKSGMCRTRFLESKKKKKIVIIQMWTPQAWFQSLGIFKSLKGLWLSGYWLKTILQNENLQGGWGNEKGFLSGLSNLCLIIRETWSCVRWRKVVIAGVQFLFTAGVGVCVCICVRSRARVRSVRRFFEKAVAFRTLIEIISMRIEPSQLTSVLRDYPCVSPNSTSPSAFTFPGFFFLSFKQQRASLWLQHERTSPANCRRACCSTWSRSSAGCQTDIL